MKNASQDVIAQAAALVGQNRIDFVLEAAHRAALQIIEDHEAPKAPPKKFGSLLKETEAYA